MNTSNIAWCHGTWNPWIGCHGIAPECVGCYAKADREKKKYDFGTLKLTSTWNDPYELNSFAGRQGRCAFMFASSYTDWFHTDADTWRDDAWGVVRDCKNIVWLVLTKRPERIADQLPADWTTNFSHVWLGTTVGHHSSFSRVDSLRSIPCSKRFISVEPLLEDISSGLDLTDIGWMFTGGMSGELWRQKMMRIEWAASLYDLSRQTRTPYFFKQVSAALNERGCNALALHLAEREGRVVDPASVDLCREIPDTPLPLIPLNLEKGRRFTAADWGKYKSFQSSLNV